MSKKHESIADELKTLAASSDVSEELKQAISELQTKTRRRYFKSEIFLERCVAFLTAKPDDLLGIGGDQLLEFCIECRKANAENVIEGMTDRYTAQAFGIDSDTLSYLGIQFSKSGFDDCAIRCFKRAGEIIETD